MTLFSLPNLLSLSRLPLAAAFLLTDAIATRAAIVGAVALTDLADGFLARRIASHDRRAGQLIDPITDKLFVLIALTTFVLKRELSLGTFVLLLARDIYNSLAFFLLKARKWAVQFRARLSGKVVTVLQLAVLFALLFWHDAVQPLIWLTVVASVLSIADYTIAALRQRQLAAARPAQ